jgi:NAD(P)H-dependent FMN reductase
LKKVLAICGSASRNSSNERLIDIFASLTKDEFDVTIYNDLKSLPHFDPQLSSENPPLPVLEFRQLVENADGVVICTPEYIFSIPSGLKNAIEWCVATTVFSDKPLGIITASAQGQKGHDELRLIMQTVMAKFTDDTTLLIAGVKGKINEKGEIVDGNTKQQLLKFVVALKGIV